MVLRPSSLICSRGSLVRAAVGLTSAFIVGGCASNAPAPKASVAKDAMFPSPASIRPNDSNFKVAPMPVDPTPAPVASARPLPRPSGEWAPPVAARPWRYIVIHHSASPSGNAAAFDREHREKGWDELGYHFVIDNGRGGGDGVVEVGPRWEKQKYGAHAKTPDNRFNDYGIGICFVGNFQESRPTAKQMASASRLVAWLMQTYKIPADHIVGHGDTKQTLCPGRNMSVATVRTMAERTIAQLSGKPTPAGGDELFDNAPVVAMPPLLASGQTLPPSRELLRDGR